MFFRNSSSGSGGLHLLDAGIPAREARRVVAKIVMHDIDDESRSPSRAPPARVMEVIPVAYRVRRYAVGVGDANEVRARVAVRPAREFRFLVHALVGLRIPST